jgi:acyl carrier protein
MERNEISEKIRRILTSVLKHEKFEMKDELTATEVDGWDSLSHITIISEIEEEFKIKFKLKELNKLNNIGSLINIVESKLS